MSEVEQFPQSQTEQQHQQQQQQPTSLSPQLASRQRKQQIAELQQQIHEMDGTIQGLLIQITALQHNQKQTYKTLMQLQQNS